MEKIEFTLEEYKLLLKEGYKFIEINATGMEVNTEDDEYKKEILLTAFKTKPTTSDHYILPITDKEIEEMALGNNTDIFFIHRN